MKKKPRAAEKPEVISEAQKDVVGNDNVPEAQKADATKKGKEKYVVKDGASFRDIADYSKVWSEGDDVSHFTQDRIEALLSQGLIEKV